MASSLDELFAAVRRADLRDVLGRRYRIRRDGFFEENPLRTEKTSSIRINDRDPSRWHDFGNGDGGDLVDFLEKAENLSVEAARELAAELLGVDLRPRSRTGGGPSLKPHTAKGAEGEASPEPPADVDLELVAKQAHAALYRGESKEAKKALAYLTARGIPASSPVLKHARVGVIDQTVDLPEPTIRRSTWTGRVVFPYAADGRTLFLNARTVGDAKAKYLKPAGLQQAGPFHAESLDGKSHAILVEGELDALAVLEALGVETPVVATGGGGLRHQDVGRFRDMKNVFLLFDADESGRRFTRDARTALEALGVTVWTLTLPNGSKDPSEALVKAGAAALRSRLEDQIDAARRGGDFAYLRTTFLEELDRRHARPYPAFSTFLAPVDALLDGGYHEGLHVLGGLTAGGKTSFALHLSLENALRGRDVLYATFEQSRLELWARLASAVTSLPYRALKRGTYQELDGSSIPAARVLREHQAWSTLLRASEHLRILEAGDALSGRDGAATVDSLRELAERLKNQNGVPPLVVIDYLQRVPVPALASRDVRERVDHVVGLLQVGIAREVGSPVLALSSLNRAGYGKNGERVSLEEKLSALKESGGIEFTAYSVALLYGYRQGNEPAGFIPGALDRWRPTCFDLVKNREGTIGEVPVRWTPAGDGWSADATVSRGRPG